MATQTPLAGPDQSGTIDGFVPRSLTFPDGATLPYRLYQPKGYPGSRLPLIVWFHGLGGAGTDNVAQIVLVCPMFIDVATSETVEHLSKAPLWAFEDQDDVRSGQLGRLLKAIEATGEKPRYAEYPGMGHAIWSEAFADPELADWVFAQHR
jgi:predicted peptidase